MYKDLPLSERFDRVRAPLTALLTAHPRALTLCSDYVTRTLALHFRINEHRRPNTNLNFVLLNQTKIELKCKLLRNVLVLQVVQDYKRLSGDESIGFSNATYGFS